MIDYGNFEKALKHLELQNNNLQALDDTLPDLLKEAVAESVIQRFKACYDCLWTVLKRYLDEELILPELPNSPKPLLRIAAENALLPAPIEDWLAYADARTATAHDYSEKKMKAVLALMPGFVEGAIGLYQRMTANSWD